MADKVGALPNKGQTLLSGAGRTLTSTYGTSVGVEGYVKQFDDVVAASAGGVKTFRSSKQRTCMLVRNVSGIALAGKRAVKWKSGFRNRRVDGYVCIAAEQVAGVVDDEISSAGVPNHDLFWLHVGGPCIIETNPAGDDTNVIAEGGLMIAVTAANSTATTISGRLMGYAVTTNTTYAASGIGNACGRAMSARVTTQSSTDTLIDLTLLSS